MNLGRRSGILAHPTSFPSPYGIGDMGPGAYDFIDFARKCGAGLWQVLPLGPTGFGDSPYQSFSTFAGNPLIISPDLLLKEGLLSVTDLSDIPFSGWGFVDFECVLRYKTKLFYAAFNRFRKRLDDDPVLKADFGAFTAANDFWLKDYALFAAAKTRFIEDRRMGAEAQAYEDFRRAYAGVMSDKEIKDVFYGASWYTWPKEVKTRANLARIRSRLGDGILFHEFLQFVFFRQWNRLKAYANESGLDIIGDIPIFVALDSADVWVNQDLFCLDGLGLPTEVAGVPPDYFSATGQLWGNPLYNWPAHRKEGYEWWIQRVGFELKRTDILRIDHFRGFDAYWAVPMGSKTAERGKWRRGPGKELFDSLQEALGALPLIAEDLGVITPAVCELRDGLGLPGMKVLQFAFDSGPANAYLPHNYRHSNTVVYTGTHDNDTTIGWYASACEDTKDFFRRYMNVSGDDANWDLLRLALSSTAAYAIAPLQDILSLGTESRMNIPGTPFGNWRFRYTDGMLSDAVACRMNYLNSLFGRIASKEEAEPTYVTNEQNDIDIEETDIKEYEHNACKNT